MTINVSEDISKANAVRKFVLQEKDVEDVKPVRRVRSAYLGEPETIFYRESDLVEKAVKVLA